MWSNPYQSSPEHNTHYYFCWSEYKTTIIFFHFQELSVLTPPQSKTLGPGLFAQFIMRRSCTTTGFQAMHSWVQFAHQSRHLRPMNAVTGISPLSGINQHRFFIIRHQRIFPQHNLNTASSVLLKSRINYNSCSRRFCTTNEDKFSSRSRRVEINLSETSDKVALSFIKKYGKKVAIEWPKKGLKFAALATGGTLLAVGGEFSYHPPICPFLQLHLLNPPLSKIPNNKVLPTSWEQLPSTKWSHCLAEGLWAHTIQLLQSKNRRAV